MLRNLVSHPAKGPPTVNTSPQTHLSYLFQCLQLYILTLCQSYTVEVSVTRKS